MAPRNRKGHLTLEGYAEVFKKGGTVFVGEGKTRRQVGRLEDIPKAAELVRAGVLKPEEAQSTLDRRIEQLTAERDELLKQLNQGAEVTAPQGAGDQKPPDGSEQKPPEGGKGKPPEGGKVK